MSKTLTLVILVVFVVGIFLCMLGSLDAQYYQPWYSVYWPTYQLGPGDSACIGYNCGFGQNDYITPWSLYYPWWR